jgi:translocation and assembly module TamB
VKKALIIVAALVVFVVGLAASGWWWLTSTQPGAGWILNRAAGAVPSLRWASVEGDLREGLTILDLEINEADTRVSIARLELAVRLKLPPSPSLEIDWIRASDGRIELPAGSDDASSSTEPFALPNLSSPIPVRVHEITIRNFFVQAAGEGGSPIAIERVHLVADISDVLELDTLEVELPSLSASASGSLGLSDPFPAQLAFSTQATLDNGVEGMMTAGVRGDLNELNIDLAAEGPGEVSGDIRLRDPLGEIDAQIALIGRAGGWPNLDLGAEDIELNAQGNPQDWQAGLAGQLVGSGLPANTWQLDLAGSMDRIELRSGLIELLEGRLEMVGEVNLGETPRALAQLEIIDLNLYQLTPQWPEAARLSGALGLDASPSRIEVNDLRLTAPPTALALNGKGHWSITEDDLAVDLSWSDLAWPPLPGADDDNIFQSRSGTLQVAGPLSDWRLELDGLIQLLEQPELNVEARASGNLQQARIERLVADAGDAGRAMASGEVQMQPEAGARLDLNISELDTGRFSPELPGRLSADLGLTLQSPDALAIDLRALDGQLRNQPLSGQGELSFSREQPEAGALNLTLGDNQLDVTSADGRTWQVQLAAKAVQQLLPPLSGQLDLSGLVDLEAGRSQLAATLLNASYDNIVLGQAAIESSLQWQDERPSGELLLELTDLDLNPWERIEQLEMTLEGFCDDHRGQLNLVSQRGSVDLGVTGALNSCQIDQMQGWTGILGQLYLGNTIAGDWALDEPSEMSVSAGNIQTNGGCLVGASAEEGRICLESLTIADGGAVGFNIDKVPMDLLLVPLDPIVNLTTPLSGQIQAGWSAAGGLTQLAGELRLDAGILQPLGTDTSLLDIDSMRLAFEPEDDVLKVSLDALLEGDSRLSGEARLDDLNDFGSATLDARASLNLPDIGVFNRLVTDLDQLSGRLTSEIQLKGALLGPELDGEIQLTDGLLVNAPLGLRVEDMDLQIKGTETSAELSGTMRGGEGTASIQGALALVDNQWQFDTRIQGENFVFADVDWLGLRASPQLHLTRSVDGLTTIDGDIRIDHLRAGVPPGTAERVTASEDIRVRGEVEDDADNAGPTAQLQGRLGLDLGEDARLSAVGLQARLSGGLELNWNRQSIEPQASGVIGIPEGSYQAYGQNLEIEGGEIVFTGHAVDNPGLDIEAVREIFGDPQVEFAGVRIRGNAQAPRINLFTEPPTSEEKALAYVVTGANFDHASGQAAVNIGFYLLPRLFVSYGIGLFEAGNVLSGRYELSRRWGVRVVSGERDTGVDLSYAIDR